MVPTERKLTVEDIRRYLKVCEWGDVPDMAQSIFESMKLDGFLPLTAALAVEAGAVGVKPLEWNPYRAETPFGWYEINDQRDVPESELKGRFPFLLCGSRLDYSRHASLQAAKAAAQADYEARIRSALTTKHEA